MARTRHEPDESASLPEELLYGRPKGAQLREILEGLVRALPAGELLPSERVLAERYGVARMTVRAEIDRMAAEGLVNRRRREGTFVAAPKLVQSESVASFSHDMRSRGMVPGARVLSTAIDLPTPYVAGRLGVGAESLVLQIVRVRTADGEPMALERANLPVDRFPGLHKVDLTDASLWAELERRWRVRVESSEHRVSAVLPRQDEAEILGVSATQPCFAIEALSRDGDGVPIEHGRSLYRGDRYELLQHAHRS